MSPSLTIGPHTFPFGVPDALPTDVFVPAPHPDRPDHPQPLRVQLATRVDTPEKAAAMQSEGLLYDWQDATELVGTPVSITCDLRGVLRDHTAPRAHFTFAENRHEESFTNIQVSGLAIGKFDGTLELLQVTDPDTGAEVDVARVSGLLKRFSFDEHGARLEALIPYNPLALRLEDYGWASLDELARVPPERVRHVDIERDGPALLPRSFRKYTRLRSLRIAERDYLQDGRLEALPDFIGQLKELRRLSLYKQPLTQLPPGIGDLPHLRELYACDCGLEALPDTLDGMPALQQLTVLRCGLRRLPRPLRLPALRRLLLDGNALTELPAGLARDMPKLTDLHLEDNPFERLPGDLDAIPTVKLSLDVRGRLAPKPAAAGGDYDAAVYSIEGDEAREAQLGALLTELALDPKLEVFLRRAAQPAVELSPRYEEDGLHEETSHDQSALTPRPKPLPTDYATVGTHRFGGLPDVPAGTTYPRFSDSEIRDGAALAYEFIAQLNCTELAPLQDYLPRTGMLYFYLSTQHDLYGAQASPYPVGLVVHEDVLPEDLVPGNAAFPELREGDYLEVYDAEPVPGGTGVPAYRGYDVAARAAVGLPPGYPLRANTYYLRGPLHAAGLADAEGGLTEEAQALTDTDAYAEFEQETPGHVIGGYGFSQHELPAHEAAEALGGDPADYLLLLEVKSRGGMQWGDAGELHYVIHKGALARRDFSGVWVGNYSS